MDFSYSTEELMFQRSLNSMFADNNSVESVRSFIESDEIKKILRELFVQQGILNVIDLDDEEEKGMIAGVIIAQEAGRFLLTYPYIEAILATALLKESKSHEKIITDILAGELLPTIAWTSTDLVIEKRDNNFFIANGKLEEVAFANQVDIIIASVRILGSGYTKQEEESLIIFERNNSNLSIQNCESMDETYPLYNVFLNNYQVKESDILFDQGMGVGYQKMEKVKMMASLLLAAEIAGASEQMMKETVEYMKERKQFGVPIGMFQALKHMAADMFIEVESMKAAIDYGAWTIDVEHTEMKEATSIAKSYSSTKGVRIAGDAIQMHGGIGYTWENNMHLYYKRIRRAASLLGDAYEHKAKIANITID